MGEEHYQQDLERYASRDAFTRLIRGLYEKGLDDIGLKLDNMNLDQLKMLTLALNSRGLDIGSMGIFASYPDMKPRVLELLTKLGWVSHQDPLVQEKICEEMAKIIDEV